MYLCMYVCMYVCMSVCMSMFAVGDLLLDLLRDDGGSGPYGH